LGEGLRAIAHETTALVVSGRFSAPRFVEGTGTDVGALRRDEDALPLITGSDQVPFVLIVPQGADMTRLPLVVSQHGFSASRTTGFALADSAGRAGHAVLAIDAFQHGERAKSARDELHALRGDVDGADGFAETTQLDVSSRMFGLSGGADGMALFPGYAQAAFAQFAADVMSAVRLAREGDIDAIRAAHPLLSNLAFDADRIAFVGNSMGAVVGMSLLVAEPHVRAAVLNVLPGSIVETLCESGEFRSLTSTLLLPQVGVSEVFDEIDRAMVFDPTVDLLRWVLEPIDPLALARYVAVDRRAAAGPVPDVLIQLAGHDEVAAPTASESVVSAARIAGHGAFQFAPVDALSLPASGPQVTGAVRFAGAMHGMLEVHTQASRFEPPLLPPLVPRAAQVGVDNPIDDVHAQIETFLRSFLEEGHGAIAVP
jgi:pimeloyl-ACP methyl ester carboxylesterase